MISALRTRRATFWYLAPDRIVAAVLSRSEREPVLEACAASYSPPVPGAVHTPLNIDKPAPTTLQPPVRARAPMLSPFTDPLVAAPDARDDGMMGNAAPADAMAASPAPRAPMLTSEPQDDVAAANKGAATGPVAGAMMAGRRSSPMLTGY